MSGLIRIAVQYHTLNATDFTSLALDRGADINFEHNSPPLQWNHNFYCRGRLRLSNPEMGLIGLIRLMGRQSFYFLISLSLRLLVPLSPCIFRSRSLSLSPSSSSSMARTNALRTGAGIREFAPRTDIQMTS